MKAKDFYLAMKRAGIIIHKTNGCAAIDTFAYAKWCEAIGAKLNPDLQAILDAVTKEKQRRLP